MRHQNHVSLSLIAEHRPQNRARGYMRQLSTAHEIGRIDVVRIVCIGQCRPHHFLSDEILDIPGFKVSTELDYRRLGSTSHSIPALTVIHDSLPLAELV